MIIKSRNRRYFKISLLLILAIVFFIFWLKSNNTFHLFLTAFLLFPALLEFFIYNQTTLELNNSQLKVQRKILSNLIHEEYEIELKNIRTYFYEKKKYDGWELYHRLFWELFLSSGQSFLIIHKLDGTKNEIQFNGNERELERLMEELPNRVGER